MLTYNGRKRYPVMASLALLDTRVLEYQHVVIGTVITTLNASMIMLTFFPNFVMSLSDPNLPSRLKVRVQITGVQHVASSHIATLHQQVCYHVQDHAVDLSGYGSGDALYVLSETADIVPTIVNAPR